MKVVNVFDDGTVEIECVVCGEPLLMQAGDNVTALVRNNGTDIEPVHESCKDSKAAALWLAESTSNKD